MTPDASRADMTRAVMEGVAFSLADARAALEAGGGSIGQVGFTGGGAKSRFWAQLIADAIDRPILRYRDAAMGPAFGAARLARMGSTGETPGEVCAKPTIEEVFTPSAGAVEANLARLERWRGLYRAVTG